MSTLTEMQRSQIEWVNINELIPNPLNPRKDDSIESEVMQEILKNRGWEEPLTCYAKGKMYVLLAGHRRLYAAREAKIKLIPVYIVDAPATYQEELDRIASLQSGRVDWTAYEWARFTYERYLSWGRPPIKDFAKKMSMKYSTVEQAIQVLSFYDSQEIEMGLRTNDFSMSMLLEVALWLKALKKHYPDLVEELSFDLIRKILVEKLAAGRVDRETLRCRHFFDSLDIDGLKHFIINRDATLSELLLKYQIDPKKHTFHGSLVSIGATRMNIERLAPNNPKETDQIRGSLELLKKSVEAKLESLGPLTEQIKW